MSEIQRYHDGGSLSGEYETMIDYVIDASARTLTQEMCYPSCGDQVVQRKWDGRGRLVSANAGAAVGVDWTYDDTDRRQSAMRRHANQKTTSFSYDGNDRLTNIAHYAGPWPQGGDVVWPKLAMQYGYDAEGNREYTLQSVVGLDNRSEAYDHDARNRLRSMNRGYLTLNSEGTAMVEQPNFLEHTTLKQKEDWVDLDRRGNWLEFGDSINGDERVEKRIANAANGYVDIHPNTTHEDPLPCPPTNNTCPSPVYDNCGNMTFDPLGRVAGYAPNVLPSAGMGPGQEFLYDFENRVQSIHRDATEGQNLPNQTTNNEPKVLAFVYDALGRRVETTEYVDPATGTTLLEPRKTRHVYFGLETIQEYSCGTNWPCSVSMPLAREFLWGDAERFPEPIAMTRYDTDPVTISTYHYLHDVLGSVIGLVDEAGTLIERYTYDPYGKVLIEKWDQNGGGGNGAWLATAEPDSGLPYSAYGNPWMWTGQRYDTATGTYAFKYRIYFPQLGRFGQRDPIGYRADSLNLYEYTLSNPYYWTDPLGLWPEGTHTNLIYDLEPRAGYPEDFMQIFIKASKDVDKDQSEEGAFKHSMRAPGESPEEAEKKLKEWMKENEDQAILLFNEGCDRQAWYRIGLNLHPIMDGTSPAHKGWQPSYDPRKNWRWILKHLWEESKITPEEFNDTVKKMELYLNTVRERIRKEVNKSSDGGKKK